jgi:7,8-dihydroneopterin aldolase/epimerase/oxygenase
MDKLIIKDLEVYYKVGVPAAERQAAQRLLLCLEMALDFTTAARDDDLSATIDYYQLTRRLLGFGAQREWKLIETLALDIADMILQDFRPRSVTIRVKKFILPETRYVAAEVTRPS